MDCERKVLHLISVCLCLMLKFRDLYVRRNPPIYIVKGMTLSLSQLDLVSHIAKCKPTAGISMDHSSCLTASRVSLVRKADAIGSSQACTYIFLSEAQPACACSRLDFTIYAVNRLPFVKASCRSLEAPPVSSEGVVPHPFVAFFTSFSRAKAAACWLSERGEEVYVHRFRANKSVEGKWHPLR